jgi:branched-chain amino acid transport system substrate-binding protein
MWSSRNGRALALAAALVVTAGVTGCGGSDEGGDSTEAAASTASTPAVAKPTGKPIVLADISDTTGAGSISAVIAQFPAGAEAAVKYLNEEQGGIGGRPVELFTCDSKTDPAATSSCATAAVQKKSVAKIGLSVLWGDNGIPIAKRAGLPSMNAPVSAQDSTAGDISFPLGGGSGSEWPGQIKYWAENMGMKKAVLLADDNSTGRVQVANQQKTAKEVGVELIPVYLKVGAADPTPTIAKAVSQKPDVIFTAASGAAAVAVYRALQQQGFPADKVVNQGAAVDEESFFSKVPANLVDGSYYTYEFDSFDDMSNPEIKIYRDAMKKYGPNDGRAEFYQWGFSNVMTIAQIAEKEGVEDFDAKTLKDFLTTVEDTKAFMGGQLSRKSAPKDQAALIQPTFRIMQYKDGKLNNISDGYINPFEDTATR